MTFHRHAPARLRVALLIAGLFMANSCSNSPAGPPLPADLVFESDKDGNPEVYVMSESASEAVRLTDDHAEDRSPAWSPDGTKIMFASNRTGTYDLFVMDADGDNVQQITDHPGDEFDPDWSPDGSRIAFTLWPKGTHVPADQDMSAPVPESDIYVVDAAGGELEELIALDGWEETPVWSPDGGSILFQNTNDLFSFEIKTERMKMISKGTWMGGDWSADGERITYSKEVDEAGVEVGKKIFVAARDGGKQKQITNNDRIDTSPVWSPDGSSVAFVSSEALTMSSDISSEIYLIDISSEEITRVTSFGAITSSPDWRPTGE